MAKLFPPILEATLPAFYGNTITIPFVNNRSVGIDNIKGFSVKIKTLTDSEIYNNNIYINVADFYNNQEINIRIIESLQIGNFYKIQIAYIDIDNTVGFYSTIGIAKYTNEPILSVGDLANDDIVTINIIDTIKCYYQNEDINEKLYSSSFVIMEKTETGQTKFYDSGEIIHINNQDGDYKTAIQEFEINKTLDETKAYYATFSVITTNNLQAEKTVKLLVGEKIPSSYNGGLLLEPNIEEAYIKITLSGDSSIPINPGNYYLVRREENSTTWEVIKNIQVGISGAYFNEISVLDFCIEPHKTYYYGIREYNLDNGMVSEIVPTEQNGVSCDYEYMYLYDGARQLKIKYNEQMSSYKLNVLEQKTDTIGGKYPFIFRNGQTHYKEGNISGTISYEQDQENLFNNIFQYTEPHRYLYNGEEIVYGEYKFTNDEGKDETVIRPVAPTHYMGEKSDNNSPIGGISANKFHLEKEFKNDVLEWLNNGEPKLLKTRAEGNFIVRVMNVSLTPQETIGRMLHDFSATVIEIDDYSFTNLKHYKVFKDKENKLEYIGYQIKSIEVYGPGEIKLDYQPENIKFSGFPSGTLISYKPLGSQTYESAYVSYTGQLFIDMPVEKTIKIGTQWAGTKKFVPTGVITYSINPREHKVINYFNIINGTKNKEMFISKPLNLYQNDKFKNTINNLFNYDTHQIYIKHLKIRNSTNENLNINYLPKTNKDNEVINYIIQPNQSLTLRNIDLTFLKINNTKTQKPEDIYLTLVYVYKQMVFKEGINNLTDIKNQFSNIKLDEYDIESNYIIFEDGTKEILLAKLNNNQRLNYYINEGVE